MSRQGANVLEAKRKKFKSLVDLESPSQYLSYLLCFDNDHPRGLFGARNGQKAKFFTIGAPLGRPEVSKGAKRGPKSEKFRLLAVLGPEKASGVVIIKT